MVVSSVKRHASIDELKERKKIYDEVNVRYNSNLQSNMFRIREIYGNDNYTSVNFMESELRDILFVQDNCVTQLYDDYVNNDNEARVTLANKNLDHCKPDAIKNIDLTMTDLYLSLLECAYKFTDLLFTAVKAPAPERGELSSMEDKARHALKNKIDALPSARANSIPVEPAKSIGPNQQTQNSDPDRQTAGGPDREASHLPTWDSLPSPYPRRREPQ
jgi:hypothetical protein